MMKMASELDRVEQAWRSGRWSADLPEQIWNTVESAPTVRSLQLALNIQHAVSGLDDIHLTQLEHYLADLKLTWQPLSLRLLCAQLQSGQVENARRRLTQELSGPINFWRARSLARFPLALTFFEREQPERLNRQLALLARQARLLIENSQAVNGALLQSILRKSTLNKKSKTQKPRIAIVGNGPSLLQNSSGKCIDEHELVVRFNRPHLQESYRRYAGSRTDLWVISPGLRNKQSDTHVSAMAISGINALSGESRYWRKLPASPDMPVAHFHQQHWYSLVSKLQAPPSAGLLTLASLDKESENFAVTAFGFTESENASNAPPGSHYGDKHQASSRHNWVSEAQLISEWIARNKNSG